MAYAHILAYEHFRGPIPLGLELDHKECDTPGCVSPWHTEAVTHQTNILRGSSPAAINARKTECINGHAFTPENTYQRKDKPARQCRACCRDRDSTRRQ
jgi:hypothetical protein